MYNTLWKTKLFSEYGEKATKINMNRERIGIGTGEKAPAEMIIVLEGEDTLQIGRG